MHNKNKLLALLTPLLLLPVTHADSLDANVVLLRQVAPRAAFNPRPNTSPETVHTNASPARTVIGVTAASDDALLQQSAAQYTRSSLPGHALHGGMLPGGGPSTLQMDTAIGTSTAAIGGHVNSALGSLGSTIQRAMAPLGGNLTGH